MSVLARNITLDEVATYRTVGVVLLRGILDLKAVNLVRRSIDEAAATIEQCNQGYDFSRLTRAIETSDDATIKAADGGQHEVSAIVKHIKASGKPMLYDSSASARDGRFLIDTAISARLKEFRRFTHHGAGAEIAGQLLQSREVRFFGDQTFVKEPGTRERTAIHQDATYFEIDGNDCCVLWVPVDPVTVDNGAMVYVRGSHRDGKLYKPNVFVSQTSLPGAEGETLPDIDGHPDDYDLVHFNVEPGDVIVHHFRTLHGSGGNLSRYQPRRAASIRYCGDDIHFKKRPWTPRQLHQTTEVIEGAPLHGRDFPIVWRRRAQNAAA